MNLMIPVMLAVLAQPGTDPQKLFLSMEEKIANASSVQFALAAKLESKKGNGTAKGPWSQRFAEHLRGSGAALAGR